MRDVERATDDSTETAGAVTGLVTGNAVQGKRRSVEGRVAHGVVDHSVGTVDVEAALHTAHHAGAAHDHDGTATTASAPHHSPTGAADVHSVLRKFAAGAHFFDSLAKVIHVASA